MKEEGIRTELIQADKVEDNMAKILIAEDERDIRDLITFTLRFAGHEVIAAANGEEANSLALSIYQT